MISANIKLLPLISFFVGENFIYRGILLMMFSGEIHHGAFILTPLVKQDINVKCFQQTNLLVQQLKLYNCFKH